MAGMPPGAGGQGAAPKEPTDDGKLIDLTKTKLDASECYARNEASGFPMTNLFIGDTRLGCKSDTDEQLILHVAFNEFVKVRTKKARRFNFFVDICETCAEYGTSTVLSSMHACNHTSNKLIFDLYLYIFLRTGAFHEIHGI